MILIDEPYVYVIDKFIYLYIISIKNVIPMELNLTNVLKLYAYIKIRNI